MLSSKKILVYLFVVAAVTVGFLTMRQDQSTKQENHLKVGVTAGPHAIIMEKVKELGKQYDLHIEIIEFNDFIMPNEALHHGEIDINVYQHNPFLEEQVKTRGYDIVAMGDAVLMPMAIYSKRYKSIQEIPNRAMVTIPNDPTNGSRALLLLEKAGLIQLAKTLTPTIMDIKKNTKNIKIVEMDAPQLPRTLDDVAAAVINTDWIIVSKVDPKTAIYREDKKSPYMNVMAVRKTDKDNLTIKKFKELYQSKPVGDFINETFQGLLVTGEA